jgi:hypothetical protein
MTKLEFTEKINFEICKKLKNLTLSQFTELLDDSTTKRKDDYDIKKEYTRLKSLCNAFYKSNNNHKVIYGFVENKDFGRLQAKNASLQRVFNGFRGILSHNITYDLDMVNCHVAVMVNLCKKHKIRCDELEKYIENRDDYLNEIMIEFDISRSIAKTLFLKCLNKEELTPKYNKKIIKSKKFIEFDKQTSEIINFLYEKFEKDYIKHVQNETYNKKGKLVNLILCKIENEFLNKAIEYITIKNIQISTLMFDGLMIYINDSYDIKDIISDLNKLFKKENIKWTVKEHNNELLQKLNSMELKEVDSYIASDIIDLSDYLLNNLLKDKLIKCNDDIFFLTNDKIIKNRKVIEMELYNIISYHDYNIINGDNIINASKNHVNIKNIVECVINKCETNNKFIEDVWRYTQFKIFFQNGYYDFKENKFIMGIFNKTFIKLNKNYSSERNKEAYDIIMNKILYPVFSIDNKEDDKLQYELLEFFLHRMSRIMAGCIEDKVWVLLQGLRNCGKGVLSDLLKNSFESYIMTTNSGNFILKKSNSVDSAKSLSWILDYQFSRLAITQEITIDDNEKIDGNMIKKFCSGGDYLQARKNHQDEIEFRIQSSLMICCNDLPEIKPSDTMEFCNEFQMKSKFVDDDFDISKKLDTFKYYKKDNDIKNIILNRDDIIMEFINLLFEYYHIKKEYPKQIQMQIEENNDDDDYKTLFNLFHFTNDENDYINNDELKNIVKQAKIPFELKKCKMLLKTKGVVDGRNNASRGLKGLKLVSDDS